MPRSTEQQDSKVEFKALIGVFKNFFHNKISSALFWFAWLISLELLEVLTTQLSVYFALILQFIELFLKVFFIVVFFYEILHKIIHLIVFVHFLCTERAIEH